MVESVFCCLKTLKFLNWFFYVGETNFGASDTKNIFEKSDSQKKLARQEVSFEKVQFL